MHDGDQAVWTGVVSLAVLAGALDCRTRKIPNWLTIPGMLIGVTIRSATQGWPGAKSSIEGAGIALALLLPFVVLKGLGAGDWKLMGALGAFLGPVQISVVLCLAVLLSGLFAVAQIAWNGQLRQTLRNLWEIVRGLIVFGLRPNPRLNLDNPSATSLPFGVMAALGTLLCFWAGHFGP